MHEALEDGIGERWVADEVVPLVQRQLGGGDGGTARVAVLDDLEQVAALGGVHRREAPVVEDEQVGFGKAGEELGVAAVAAADVEFGEQPWQAQVEGAEALAAGLVSERAGDAQLLPTPVGPVMRTSRRSRSHWQEPSEAMRALSRLRRWR